MSNWNSDGLGHLRAGPLHEPIPRDEPEYMDEHCSQDWGQCLNLAIEQGRYDELMCETHFRDAVLWDSADNMNQIGWEE